MPAKKKPVARSKKASASARQAPPKVSSMQISNNAQTMVFVFTMLSVLFVIMAFWRYG